MFGLSTLARIKITTAAAIIMVVVIITTGAEVTMVETTVAITMGIMGADNGMDRVVIMAGGMPTNTLMAPITAAVIAL
jgi:hypothetical protein